MIDKHYNVYPCYEDEIFGISLREYFAIKCLQPLLIHDKPEFDSLMVKRAVAIAGMLVEELNKDENAAD